MKQPIELDIKRLDHLGVVAGTIRDLGIIELIDEHLGKDSQELVTSGQAVAAMILNFMGYASRPLMLTPQYYETKPVKLLLGENVTPDLLNRHKLGRTLVSLHEFGCEKIFKILALHACMKENVNVQYAHADTTSISLNGSYDSASDLQGLKLTHGHSKDMRKDLVQAVLELVTSQDGGIPLIAKVWDGNASDTVILRERVIAVLEEFVKATGRCLVADCKLYAQKTAAMLNKIYFITRVPSTLNREQSVIANALSAEDAWMTPPNQDSKKTYKFQEFKIDQFDIDDQRWIVVHSKQTHERAKKSLTRAVAKEVESIKKELFHLQATRFSCEADAKKELALISKKWKFHLVSEEKLTSKKIYQEKGHPTVNSVHTLEWKIEAQSLFDQPAFDRELNQRSCFVLATNISPEKLPMNEVLEQYKEQDNTEKGFAFIKTPEFFASSLFLKSPARIEAMLTIMVLTLLVYSIAQRHLRKTLNKLEMTLPNQINQPTKTPTLRMLIQVLEGINCVKITQGDIVNHVIEGLTDSRKLIISLFSENVQKIYQISGGAG